MFSQKNQTNIITVPILQQWTKILNLATLAPIIPGNLDHHNKIMEWAHTVLLLVEKLDIVIRAGCQVVSEKTNRFLQVLLT